MSKGMFSDQHGLSRRDLLLVAGTAAAMAPGFEDAEALAKSKTAEDYWAKV